MNQLGGIITRMGSEEDPAAFVRLDIRVQVAGARTSRNRLLPQTVESMAHASGGFGCTGIESMEGPPSAAPPLDEHLRSAVATYVAAGPLEASR